MSRIAKWITNLTPRVALALIVACAVIVGIPVFERALMGLYIYDDTATLPHAEAALVLGASVQKGLPSPILLERAQQSVLLYRLGLVPRILISGDGEEDYYDEVTPVRDYLIAQGIPLNAIFVDPFGFDTYSSMYRAQHVFGAQTLIIVSQDFHLPRAVFIARALGIDAVGSTAPGGTLSEYIREIPASWKALFDVIMHRQAKFEGAPLPLAGDGIKTWRQ